MCLQNHCPTLGSRRDPQIVQADRVADKDSPNCDPPKAFGKSLLGMDDSYSGGDSAGCGGRGGGVRVGALPPFQPGGGSPLFPPDRNSPLHTPLRSLQLYNKNRALVLVINHTISYCSFIDMNAGMVKFSGLSRGSLYPIICICV